MLTIAYIAGLFDGEGCVYVQKANTSSLITVSIAGSYEPVLRKVQELFSGVVRGTSKKIGNRHKKPWRWEAHGRDTLYFLESVSPYLQEKKAQADIAIALPMPGRRRTKQERDKWEWAHGELKRLKREGPGYTLY